MEAFDEEINRQQQSSVYQQSLHPEIDGQGSINHQGVTTENAALTNTLTYGNSTLSSTLTSSTSGSSTLVPTATKKFEFTRSKELNDVLEKMKRRHDVRID